jgi:hypothetical protein
MSNWRIVVCVVIVCLTLIVCVGIRAGHSRYQIVHTEHTFYKLDKKTGRVWRISGIEQVRVTDAGVE